MKKYLYLFIFAIIALCSAQVQAEDAPEIGFTAQGNIYKMTRSKDFTSGVGELYSPSGDLIKKYDVKTGHPFKHYLIHPSEKSLVALNASGHVTFYDIEKFSQPYYEGKVLLQKANSDCQYYLLTYSTADELVVSQVRFDGEFASDIIFINMKDGAITKSYRIKYVGITHGQLTEDGRYLVVDNCHLVQKHGYYLSVIDLAAGKQVNIKFEGDTEVDRRFYQVQVRKGSVYFLTYLGKGNKYSRVLQYNIAANKLSVAYEADRDISQYFLSPDGVAGFVLLNSVEGLALQRIRADKDGGFVNVGKAEPKTVMRKIQFSPNPKENTLLVDMEDLNCCAKEPVYGTYISSYIPIESYEKDLSSSVMGPGIDLSFGKVKPLYTKSILPFTDYSVQTFKITNDKNGREIPVIYYYLSGPYKDASRALIVNLHGGPHSHSFPSYSEGVHKLLRLGYNILDVNYSGSTGFGKQFASLIDGDYGNEECSDIIVAINDICARDKTVDNKNIFITGHSYGAYLTLLLGLKYPYLVKGLIAVSGIYDWSQRAHQFKNAKDKVSAEEYSMRLEPYKHMSLLKSPLLLLHGGHDNICDIKESKKVYKVAVDIGKPVALYTHGADHFYKEWWVYEPALLQATSYLENLRQGTYQPPFVQPMGKPTDLPVTEVGLDGSSVVDVTVAVATKPPFGEAASTTGDKKK